MQWQHMQDLLDRLCNKFTQNAELWRIYAQYVLTRGHLDKVGLLSPIFTFERRIYFRKMKTSNLIVFECRPLISTSACVATCSKCRSGIVNPNSLKTWWTGWRALWNSFKKTLPTMLLGTLSSWSWSEHSFTLAIPTHFAHIPRSRSSSICLRR